MAGVPLNQVSGQTLREKTNSVNDMSMEQLSKMCASVGFMVSMVPGNMLIVPAGFFVLTVVTSNDACEGIRWSMVDDKNPKEKEIASAALDLLIESMVIAPKATDDIMMLKGRLDAD